MIAAFQRNRRGSRRFPIFNIGRQNARDTAPTAPEVEKRLDGRWLAALIAIVFGFGLHLALDRNDPDRVWPSLGVVPMGESFGDLYPFPAAQRALAEGEYPYAPMASERWGRSFNYPVVWLAFMRFSEQAIPIVAVTMAIGWFATLFGVVGRLSLFQGAVMAALICSPVAVLALERANTDLIVFSIVAGAVMFLRRNHSMIAWSLLVCAMTLKLFPAFAFGAFVQLGWRRVWPWLLASVIAVAVLCGIQSQEILGVLRETPSGGMLSYGSTVWVRVANILFLHKQGIPGAFDSYMAPSVVCAGLLVGVAFLSGARRGNCSSDVCQSGVGLAAFRAGGAIFLGTFVFGNHFIYRLIFIFLCVPWLSLRRCKGDDDIWQVRMVGLCLVAATFWSNPLWSPVFYYAREVCIWFLVPIMAWLLGRTLPRFGSDRVRLPWSAPGVL